MENEQTKIKTEINLLTRKLSDLNIGKKQKIQEISSIKTSIRKFLTDLKENKTKRPNIKEDLNKLKAERDIHNKKVQELIVLLKELRNQKTDIEKKTKNKTKLNPLDIKKRIDFLEEKIQTEVISFDKERKMMDELRKLKAEYKNSGDLYFNRDKIAKLSQEIKEERDKANLAHNKIKELLNSNKEVNKEFKNCFKELDSLREKEAVKQKEISEIKSNIEALNNELNTKLSAIGQIKSNLVVQSNVRKEMKKRMEEKIIEEKSRIVEDKIKNKVKLTKEDFLIYQSKLNNDE